MEIRTMRVFVTVVEEGGLSAAARRPHMSQPALSHSPPPCAVTGMPWARRRRTARP
ncbi:LysR family transcriptional regulator [Streptomyces sp. NPDC056656]|uniref:LysR family transcriptional regulator n=1 Tax=Streptomyces sp. NPDC056656 TaxID=3345895 RepID=UPI00367BFF39